MGLHRDPRPRAGPSGASSAPTSQPLGRPMSCKVSRVWLQGVSRACWGLVSGLVSWQKARHLVTRCSGLAEPWVSRLITPCNTAPAPQLWLRRPLVPTSQGEGTDQGRGSTSMLLSPPERSLSCGPHPRAFLLPNFSAVGFKGPTPEKRPCWSWPETPAWFWSAPSQKAGSCHTQARGHTHQHLRQKS